MSEYWTQKRTQSESIRSTILDVHVLKAERQNYSIFLSKLMQKDLTTPCSSFVSKPKITKLFFLTLENNYSEHKIPDARKPKKI